MSEINNPAVPSEVAAVVSEPVPTATIEAPTPAAAVPASEPVTEPALPGFAEGATLTNIPVVGQGEAAQPAAQPVPSSEAPTVQIPAAEMANLVAAPTPAAPEAAPALDQARVFQVPPELKLASIEQMAGSLPGFVEELNTAQTALNSEPALYGNLGSQAAPLEGVSLANATLRSLFSDRGESAWIKVAGQLVQVDAANRRCTIWQSFTDEQEQSKASGFDWEAIAKLKREAAVVATKAGAAESRLVLIKRDQSAQ